ncbi:MAG: acyl carrier protein [Sutterella sp.]|nr:acyl carrier protein [Sutterella sp.]
MTETLSPAEQKIFDALKEILVRDFEIDPSLISLDGRLYEDFDIDSIDAVDMIVQLKPYLGNRRLSPEAFKQVRTLGDVVAVIARVLSEPEEA